MIFDDEEDKEGGNDFFDKSTRRDEDTEPEAPKPNYKPDDPAYWEEEESEWEHLKPRSKFPMWLLVTLVVVILGLVAGCWIRFFSPYVEDASQYGYVERVEKRGSVFKTYEGTLIPYKELMDTTRIYHRDFIFSVADDKTAAVLKRAQLDARPVRVEYKQYHATVPWRGSSKIVVTAADTVDPAKILPPEFAPKR